MNLSDILKINEFKRIIEDLNAKNDEQAKNISDLRSQLINQDDTHKKECEQYCAEIEHLRSLINLVGEDKITQINSVQLKLSSSEAELNLINDKLSESRKYLDELHKAISSKKQQLISLDDELLVQEFGLYTPRFSFSSSTDFKEALAYIRNKQKELIKDSKAAKGNLNWTVNGSSSKGQKMIRDMQKLILRAFNSECDDLVQKVKYTNFDASLKKMYSIAESISKLGESSTGIRITGEYIDAKAKELRLAFEYQLKKQEEKEEQRRIRTELREAAKLQKELDEQRKKIEKEQTHYLRALTDLNKQLASNPENTDLMEKKNSLTATLSDIDKKLENIDYREANQRAGYVYVISNIGAFGEDVYKIGMTRRLDPQERVDELGDASVPFNFDVHAMIFSDDAPSLEAALHKAFEDRKLNMVNTRREFFNVTLDEIKEVVKKNFDKTVEFIDVPDAEQYRISQKLRRNQLSDSNIKQSVLY